MHEECLRHIQQTVPNWKEIFDEVERTEQEERQSRQDRQSEPARESDETTTVNPATNDKTAGNTSLKRTTNEPPTNRYQLPSRQFTPSSSSHSQLSSELSSPSVSTHFQPPRHNFWGKVMHRLSVCSCYWLNRDSDQSRLLGGNPNYHHVPSTVAVDLSFLEETAPTEIYETFVGQAIPNLATQTFPHIDSQMSSATFRQQDLFFSRLRRSRHAQRFPYLRHGNHNSPNGTDLKQQAGMLKINMTSNPEYHQRAKHNPAAYMYSNPWLYDRGNWVDEGKFTGPGRNIDDYLDRQFALSISRLGKRNPRRGIDGDESPPKKRKWDRFSISGGASYLRRG